MSDIRTYLSQTQELPDDVLLGRIVMFTITDEPVAETDLAQWVDDLGLNPDLLPAPIRTVDAFKKATTDLDGRKYPLPSGNTAHLLSREVSSSPVAIVRQITREIQDPGHRRLQYGRAIECVYERPRVSGGQAQHGTERVRFTIDPNEVTAEERDRMREVAQELKTRYDRYANFMDGMKLRQFVREYVKFLNAVEIKGGVYFVHVSRDKELLALQELVSLLGGGCVMYLIPLIDLPEQRTFVIENFQRENAEALAKIAKECAALTDSGKKVTAKSLARLRDEYDSQLQAADEYVRRLGASRNDVQSAADVAAMALSRLQDVVLDNMGVGS